MDTDEQRLNLGGWQTGPAGPPYQRFCQSHGQSQMNADKNFEINLANR